MKNVKRTVMALRDYVANPKSDLRKTRDWTAQGAFAPGLYLVTTWDEEYDFGDDFKGSYQNQEIERMARNGNNDYLGSVEHFSLNQTSRRTNEQFQALAEELVPLTFEERETFAVARAEIDPCMSNFGVLDFLFRAGVVNEHVVRTAHNAWLDEGEGAE